VDLPPPEHLSATRLIEGSFQDRSKWHLMPRGLLAATCLMLIREIAPEKIEDPIMVLSVND
jgi:hypothetical protein